MRKIKKISIDFSSLKAIRLCSMKGNYSILQKLKSSESSDALSFGTLVHKGIELLNATPLSPTELEAEVEYLGERGLPSATSSHPFHQLALEAQDSPIALIEPDYKRSLKHLLLLLTRYASHYENDPLRSQSHEQFVESPDPIGTVLGVPIHYCGTIDGVMPDTLIERKTTSYLGDSFINMIKPNDQATGYCYLSQFTPGGLRLKTIFDGIGTFGYGRSWGAATSRPGLWTINKEPGKLFMRIETHRTQADLDIWRRNVLRTMRHFLEDYATGTFAMSPGQETCYAFNKPCDFIEVCRAADAVKPTLLGNMFKPVEWKGFTIEYED